jgi:enoyl-CoA hydratase
MAEPIEGLRLERREHVAYLTLDRPARLNAISLGLMDGLVDVFAELDADDEVRAVSITGSGERAFSAGVDLKELRERGAGPPQPMKGSRRNFFEALLELGKPTLAVLNGLAVGAGCELALACDMRIAADHAYFAMPEAKRGLGANFGSVILPRLIPRAIAMQMLYTGDPLTAHEALGCGLVGKVAPGAELPEVAERLVRSVVANAPLTLRRFKLMATRGWDLPVPAALRLDVGPNPYESEDLNEGVRAFAEGREPRWSGR